MAYLRILDLCRLAAGCQKSFVRTLSMVMGLFLVSVGVVSAETGEISAGDTAWILTSAALVLFMTPGLGFFYAGMVRTKNVLSTLMHSFVMCGVVGVVWVLWGYSLAFSGSSPWIGDLGYFGLNGIGLEALDGGTIPHLLFMMFQGMFAIITAALISGAFAERIRFGAFIVVMILWTTLVYSPICHWVWASGGWLFERGALDFAGGTVVHISSGIAALAFALVLGRRKNLGSEEMAPHNLTLTILGTGILWFGWFGFNAGSALAADGRAASAFVVTNTAAAAAALSWLLVEKVHRGKPTALGAASGAVAGLVAITPASGFVNAMGALCIGAIVSLLSYAAIQMKSKLRYDDALDVVGIHFVGGAWGAIATGLFAVEAIGGSNGVFFGGGFAPLVEQIIAVVATAVYSFVVTMIILLAVKLVMPLRVTSEEETTGLDLTQHGELGYNLEAV